MSDFFTKDGSLVRSSPGYLLRKSTRLVIAQLHAAFADLDISFPQWITLMLVGDHEAVTAAQLSRTLGHNSGAVTRLIDQLEERSLIKRERSTTDRRVVELALTDAGSSIAQALAPRVISLWDELLEDFTNDEVDMLRLLLTRLLVKLEARDTGEDLLMDLCK